ncbi:hypothetical protein B0H11DRAFT_1916652 [Mycena galericulata]|nr:hypothetical protein B0H11DRAFT_1916652 [Mycena galericulata]
MVLTRRTSKIRSIEIWRWLPNELLTEIIQNVSSADQATLCRVSKLLHNLTLPVLNRTVELNTTHPRSLRTFCSALIAKPVRADAIRSFILRDGKRWQPHVPVDLIFESMQLMRRLEHLSILSSIHLMASKIPLLKFPRLVRCHIGIPGANFGGKSAADIVAQFLEGHPTLTHVRVSWSHHLAVRIRLPNLCHYEGSSEFVPAIVTGTLRATRLKWFPYMFRTTSTIDKIILALNSLTTADTPFISSHDFYRTEEDYLELLKSLSKHMPHTTSLQIRCHGSPKHIESIKHVTECLPQFNRLAYFALDFNNDSHSPRADAGRAQATVQMGTATVQAWAATCPTLEACSIYDTAWRKVDRTWQEYPIEDFLIQAGLASFEQIL